MWIVLAVALTTALFGVALPSAERADQERSTALAIDELESLTAAAEVLAEENDPLPSDETPAETAITVDVPEKTFAEGGRISIRDNDLRWEPSGGRIHSVDLLVPLRVDTPIVATDWVRIRLSLVRLNGRIAVFATPVSTCPSGAVGACG